MKLLPWCDCCCVISSLDVTAHCSHPIISELESEALLSKVIQWLLWASLQCFWLYKSLSAGLIWRRWWIDPSSNINYGLLVIALGGLRTGLDGRNEQWSRSPYLPWYSDILINEILITSSIGKVSDTNGLSHWSHAGLIWSSFQSHSLIAALIHQLPTTSNLMA